jgi:hypothetical protein
MYSTRPLLLCFARILGAFAMYMSVVPYIVADVPESSSRRCGADGIDDI